MVKDLVVVSAEPISPGAWAIECSLCGPVGVVTAGLEDLLCRDHAKDHS